MTTQLAGTRRSVAQPAAKTHVATSGRLLYIDNLRILLVTMVILIHVAITYGAAGQWGYYVEPGEMNTVAVVVISIIGAIGSSFFMGLFFMIAGYFTPRSYDRKGPRAFTVDRLIRLGIPLLVFAVVIDPLINYIREFYFGFRGWPWQLFPGTIPVAPGPLWFVEALLIFSLVYVLWRLVFQRVPPPPPPDGEARAPADWAIALFGLAVGLATFLVRIWAPVGWWLEPLHLELASFANYIALFTIGILAYRHNWLVGLSDAQGRTWAWIAAVLVVALVVIGLSSGALSGSNSGFDGGLNRWSLLASVWQQLMCIAMVVVLLVGFRKRFNHQSGLAKAMSDSTYAVYVLHPLIIVPLAVVLSPIHMEPALKFLLVAPLAVALCFLAGYGVRQLPLVRQVL